MPRWTETLSTIVGNVLAVRPRISPLLVVRFVNQRISSVINARPIWSDLLEFYTVRIPDAVTAGTVSLTKGSKIVAGTGTNWPVSDVVDTTLADSTEELGYVEMRPVSMQGIGWDSLLLVDSGQKQEILPVVEIGEDSIWVKGATKTHDAGAKIQQSSLAGRQFRVSVNHPIYTVRAVRSSTELELDEPWWSESVSGVKYRISKIYISFGPNLRFIHAGVDLRGPSPIRLHVSQAQMNWRDPQRSSTGYGGILELVDHAPSENGVMLYEIWPEQLSSRELRFLISRAWPELVRDNDRAPWFLDPAIFINGAIADALRVKVDESDPWHNPNLADYYEARHRELLMLAIQADDSRVLSTLRSSMEEMTGLLGAGSDYWQRHDPGQVFWDFS